MLPRIPLRASRTALSAALFLSAAASFALDFGAVLRTEGTLGGGNETARRSTITAAPWISLPLPLNEADLYLSAGISADYQHNREKKLLFIPELFRLELSFKPLETMTVRAGRIPYEDPSRFTAAGLFDGAALEMDLGPVTLGLAGFYTGFLYRETAGIRANPGDPENDAAPLDWSDFSGTYFAPRKAIAAVEAEYRGFISPRGILRAGLLAQFDLSRAEEKQHTQFFLVRYSLVFKSIDAAAAGALEFLPKPDGLKTAYALALEGGWRIPAALPSRLSLGLRWASGEGSSRAAFDPVISRSQGRALEPDFSGLMVIRPLWEARLLPSLQGELGGRYFIRTDSITFTDPGLAGDDSYFIGLELDGALRWVPFSDLSLSLSGAVFIPQTGKAMKDDEPLRWTVTAGALFSL